jgi:lycopene beta-cyclase
MAAQNDLSYHYDYIISGAGCAGLSLVVHMIKSGRFNNKKILLVDKLSEKKNDRTWCFWETEPGMFEPIVYHRWEKAWFYGEDFSSLLSLQPYEYKLIRGIDFYNYCFDLIREQPNIDTRFGEVRSLTSDETGTTLYLDDVTYTCQFIFNSILFEKPLPGKNVYYLLQHFKGRVIETGRDHFDPDQAILMDFRVSQHAGTTFAYVMPFSRRRALVEYTLFTQSLLTPGEYDEGLDHYIREFLGIDAYQVTEEEFGVIPMTNHRFPSHQHHIINIGTAGGQTRPSSGYTFRFIQKQSEAIVKQMIRTGRPLPVPLTTGKRSRFYDRTLLHILHHDKVPGKKIFTDLFRKNKSRRVLRFLDDESTIGDELKIISSLPTGPFLKAAFRRN